jgi:hypothetical protein
MHLSVLHKCALVAFALGVVIMRATPAAAAPSNAEITLFNNTGCTWPVVVGGASVGGAWSPEPPTSIAPGQTLSFGSASNGGVATGTGGTLPIALDTGPASITWSVPWGVFNGGWQDPSGSTDNSKDSGSSYWVSGGPSSCGGQGVDTCLFSYEISVTGKNPTCAVYTDSFKVSAMSQTPVSGCATSIAGSVGAGALATGCTTVNSGGDNIYDYSFSSNSFQQLPGQGAQIASDAGGDRFLVNAQGAIFTFDFTSDQWIQIPGCATSIAAWTSVGWVGGPGEVYITGCTKESNAGYLVYSAPFAAGDGYTVSPNITWSLMPGQGTQIALNNFSKVPWLINGPGAIFTWNGTGWSQVSGCARSIAGGLSTVSTTWTVGCTSTGANGNELRYWNGSGWTPILGAEAWNVTTDQSGLIWTTDVHGSVSYWTP